MHTITIVISNEMALALLVMAVALIVMQGISVVLEIKHFRARRQLAAALAKIGTSRAEERAEHVFPAKRR